jgi:hypothetical protein
MLKAQAAENIIGEVVDKIRLLDRRYMQSPKRSTWCEKFISLYDEWQQLKWELLDLSTSDICDLVDLETATLESKISNLQQHRENNGLNSSIVRTYDYRHNCADSSSGMNFPLNQILEGDLDLSLAEPSLWEITSHPNNRRII